MREKLTVMGPGEVYEDTLLSHLEEEIMAIKLLQNHEKGKL